MILNPAQSWLREVSTGLSSFLFPRVCIWCGLPLANATLCSECKDELLATTSLATCRRCCATVPREIAHFPDCVWCKGEHYAFDQVIRLGDYQGALAQACRAIKRIECISVIDELAEQLVTHRKAEFDQLPIDVVVSAPLFWMRRLERGFDQAGHLADCIARRLNKPFTHRWLRRKKPTVRQTEIPPSRRRANVKDAFETTMFCRAKGKSILLVDDILTTGATCHEIAKRLKAAGAKAVHVAILARGDNRRTKPALIPGN